MSRNYAGSKMAAVVSGGLDAAKKAAKEGAPVTAQALGDKAHTRSRMVQASKDEGESAEQQHLLHAAAAHAHRKAADAFRAEGKHNDADHHEVFARSHEKHVPAGFAPFGQSADEKPSSGKSSKLKAFADEGKKAASPKVLQKGKKGGSFYLTSTGKKVYTRKG